MKSTIQTLDLKMSKSIYDSFHSNKILSKTPYYLGLLPYEIYVLLGLYIAILQVIWLNNPNPIQYFILPYFFTSMIFYSIKTRFHRMRPGCYNKSMSKYMNEKNIQIRPLFYDIKSHEHLKKILDSQQVLRDDVVEKRVLNLFYVLKVFFYSKKKIN